ncbi:replicative DNA helicase [Levilactobacillus brevis]|uniref:replicative DNA helicase n=1 Tax=Levilactobacillus brevis TaxID=1580 RepID=UPI0021A421F4|nr:DnaB-like helicase C-terminal domain-containing protein [Levilactobacillus brevis]
MAALLKEPKNIELVNANSDWFVDGNYRTLFEAMQQADDTSLMTVYGKAKVLSNQFSMTYKELIELRGAAITDANLPELVRDLHRLYGKQEVQRAMAVYHEAPFEDNLMALIAATNNLAAVDSATDDGSFDSEVNELDYNLDHPSDPGIKSYKRLDETLAGGFYGGMLLTIGARPGVGKTAFSVNLAATMLKRNPKLRIDYFTLEMTKREMLNRFVSWDTGVPSTSLRSSASTLTPTIKQIVRDSAERFKRSNLAIYDTTKTLGQIAGIIRRHASEAKKNEYVAFVDYIGLITVPSIKERYLQVSEITRQLKVMANEYDVPIIELAQLNRGLEQRQDKEPQLSDLRESGSIEQDSNVVAFLTRDAKVPDVRNVVIKKNREGWLARIPYQFNGQGMKFQELDVDNDG